MGILYLFNSDFWTTKTFWACDCINLTAACSSYQIWHTATQLAINCNLSTLNSFRSRSCIIIGVASSNFDRYNFFWSTLYISLPMTNDVLFPICTTTLWVRPCSTYGNVSINCFWSITIRPSCALIWVHESCLCSYLIIGFTAFSI